MTSLRAPELHVHSHGGFTSKLRRVGDFFLNYAAVLCLIDCLVLPVLILVLRLADMAHSLHKYEHTLHVVEIACVVPLGLLSVFVNYRKGHDLNMLILGLLGIVMVVTSHMLLEGWCETACSLCGCAMLISSNYLARRAHGCHSCHGCHTQSLTTVI